MKSEGYFFLVLLLLPRLWLAGSVGVAPPLLRLVLVAIESFMFPSSVNDLLVLVLVDIESFALSPSGKEFLVFFPPFTNDSLILSFSFFLLVAESASPVPASTLFLLLALSGSAAGFLVSPSDFFWEFFPFDGGAFSSSSSSSSLLLKLGIPGFLGLGA